jgi:hypothetical protein
MPAAAAALAGAIARSGGAQVARAASPDAATSDSVAWQRVLVYAVGALATQLVGSASDTSAQAWALRLPAAEPQRPLLARQLTTLLRARSPGPGDPVVRALELGPLTVAQDTARVLMRFSEERQCAGSPETTGFAWSDTVLVPRHPRDGFWGAAQSRGGTHGDRMGCPRPGR